MQIISSHIHCRNKTLCTGGRINADIRLGDLICFPVLHVYFFIGGGPAYVQTGWRPRPDFPLDPPRFHDNSSTDISSTTLRIDISSTDTSSTTVYQGTGQFYIQLLFQQIIIFINSNVYLHYDSLINSPFH